MIRRFTGWHMTALLVAGFAVVVAVNVTMATLATRSFGGTVVDNSYVASQRFNGWLAAARAQDALGWRERVVRTGSALTLDVESDSGPIEGAIVSAAANHPLGAAAPVVLQFEALGNGRYRSTAPLPGGRWLLRIEIARGADRKTIVRDLS